MRPSRWRLCGRILLRTSAALAVLLAIAALAGLIVVQSGWFHEYVRQRIITEVERATGGRVEIGRFSFRGPTLTATLAPLVLHGTEAPGEPPLLRVESLSLGFRILSFAERRIDLATIKAEKPRLRVVVYPDGSDNFPSPGRGPAGKWPEQLIDLAAGHYEVTDGMVEIDERGTPINLRGDGLSVKLAYDSRTPSYDAEIGSRGVRVVTPGMAPLQVGFSSHLRLEKSRMVISMLHLSTPQSHADLKGILENPMAPHGILSVQAAGNLRETVAMFPLPIDRAGTANFAGTLAIDFADFPAFSISGRLNARGVGYSNGRLHIHDAAVQASVDMTAHRLEAARLQVDALGSHFAGKLTLDNWKYVHVEGDIDGLSVAEAAVVLTPRPVPWEGILSGQVTADATLGEIATVAHATLSMAPAVQGRTIQGFLDVSYNQHEDEIAFGDSWVATSATRLDGKGAWDRRMDIQLHSTHVDDLLAVLPLLGDDPPREFPLRLTAQSVSAAGTVTGPFDSPRFRGQVMLSSPGIEGHNFDSLDATVDLSHNLLSASRFTLARGGAGGTEATGSATVTASKGSLEDAAISAQFNLRNANLGQLAGELLSKETAAAITVDGLASAAVRVSGSVEHPQADLTLTVTSPRALGESLDRLSATLAVTPSSVEVSGGQADDGPGRINFAGAYRTTQADWKSGQIQLQVTTRNLPANRVEALTALGTGLDGRVSADFRAQGEVGPGGFLLKAAAGTASAQAVTLRGNPLGDVEFTAETRGEDASLSAKAKIGAADLEGTGSWRLSGDENGSASVRFSRMTLDEAHRLAVLVGMAPQSGSAPLPLEGVLEGGTATVVLALRHPRDYQATVSLDGAQFNPRPGQALGLGVQAQDVVLKTAQAVVLEVTAKGARIQPARLTGRDTNLEISGTIPFSGAAGADLAVRGSVNLVALQLINPNLLARGNATVEATLRGALGDPALTGRMDLKGASLYVKDEATGLDNVNGGVLFNRNRATIDKLTAQIGSGTVSLGGFVEFGTPLVYRLQAAAQQVRFRLPIDLSTNFSANLALNGTSDASTLSGTLTLNRAAFNPHTDLGELLEAFSAPQPEESPNDYLRGMQLDVRVASAPTFELQTSLTRDVQSEVDLRLRGTPRQPLLLGSISVNAGAVQVFGNQYTINRGDIRFTNAIRIEPVFDLALETKVSGVTVNITFTGTADKLRTNYSSDPPLEPAKIIALLAVGRDPSQTADSSSAQGGNNTNFVGAGGSLLSQAISDQLTSKLQRFLGASRVKIDPTMTGIDNTPQARLTFEQQVSKDVTMTYITNLNYTAEQIVRLQWDLNRNWSAIAVRDANGLFGIDFQYRRRFK